MDSPKYFYAIQYDKETGEIKHITMFSDNSEESLNNLIAEHYVANMKSENDYAEIVLDEFEKAHEKDDESTDFKVQIDINKAARKLKDRVKIDVPIEIDGIGGKEIIGFEQKPESIITEKSKEIEVIKSK